MQYGPTRPRFPPPGMDRISSVEKYYPPLEKVSLKEIKTKLASVKVIDYSHGGSSAPKQDSDNNDELITLLAQTIVEKEESKTPLFIGEDDSTFNSLKRKINAELEDTGEEVSQHILEKILHQKGYYDDSNNFQQKANENEDYSGVEKQVPSSYTEHSEYKAEYNESQQEQLFDGYNYAQSIEDINPGCSSYNSQDRSAGSAKPRTLDSYFNDDDAEDGGENDWTYKKGEYTLEPESIPGTASAQFDHPQPKRSKVDPYYSPINESTYMSADNAPISDELKDWLSKFTVNRQTANQ